MMATVGQESPFQRGRQQLKDLADLDVTAGARVESAFKAVERAAETIGSDIAARAQERIKKAIQLDLPIVIGKAIPMLYIEMDGTGISVVKKETVGRKGKTAGEPAHTREVKQCAFKFLRRGLCVHASKVR